MVIAFLSTLVLNSRDRHKKYGFLKKKCVYRTTWQHFPSTCCHTIYWYDAINTINPFKHLKWKLLAFRLNHSLATTIDLRPKQLGLYPPFFLVRSLFPSTRTFVIFVAFTFVFCKSTFPCVFCMITTIEIMLGAHGSLAHIIIRRVALY